MKRDMQLYLSFAPTEGLSLGFVPTPSENGAQPNKKNASVYGHKELEEEKEDSDE